MDLTPYISTLREGLTTAASAGTEDTQRTAAVLSAALEPAARLAIMNALSDLAAEVTVALEDRVVEVRLDGKDIRVVVTGGLTDDDPEPDDAPPPPPPPPGGGDGAGDISRITLRLLDELKARAEQAASSQGVSLNTFVAQAVQGALNNAGRGRDRGRDRGQGGPWGSAGPWGAGGPWGPRGPWGQGEQNSAGSEGGGEQNRGHQGGGRRNRIRGWVQG